MNPSSHDHAARTSLFNRRRPLFWIALAFCLGIFLDEILAPSLPRLGGAFAAAVAGLLLLWAFRRDVLHGRGALVAASSLAICAGAMNHAFGSRVPPAQDISRRTSVLSSFVFVEGTIIDTRRALKDDGRSEWTIAVSKLGAAQSELAPATGRVVLKAPLEIDAALAEGDIVRLCARIEAPPDLTLPGGFDLASYLKQQGVQRVGEVLPDSLVPLGTSWRPDLELRRWSATLSERVESLLPSDEPGRGRAALLNALLFGRRERVSLEDREAFAIAGTAHLLAISGLQIQFFAWLLFMIASISGLRRRQCALFVLAASCLYCALAGADAPILRATVMIVFYLGAMLLWREPDLLSILGASAIVILALSPEQLFAPGFQLSFAAVLALVTLLPALNAAIDAWWLGERASIVIAAPTPAWMLPWRERALIWLRQSLLVTTAATLGTAPIIAWHMGRVSLLSLWINIIAVPLGSICMIAGLAALASSAIPAVSVVLVAIAIGCVAALQAINAFAASLPGAAIDIPPPPVLAIAAYVAALGLLWRIRPGTIRPAQAALACGICGALLFSGLLFREGAEAPSVTMLELPRGRASLVETPDGGAALVDAGGEGDGARLANVLRQKGIHRLSLLILTADETESIGGALELLRRVPAARVMMPRSGGASSRRRELEEFLAARAIPCETPGRPLTPSPSPTRGEGRTSDGEITAITGPSSVRWQLCDDNPREGAARASASLAVRIELPGRSLLLADLRSGAAVQRLLDKLETHAESDVLCLSCTGQRWPQEAERLIQATHCRTLVVSGREPGDLGGADLEQLAQSLQIRLLTPSRDGSLRIQADTGIAAGPAVQSFKNGQWHPVE